MHAVKRQLLVSWIVVASSGLSAVSLPLFAQETSSNKARQTPARFVAASGGESRETIGLTLWVVRLGNSGERDEEQTKDKVPDDLANLPSTFSSASKVRQFVGRLKNAGLV